MMAKPWLLTDNQPEAPGRTVENERKSEGWNSWREVKVIAEDRVGWKTRVAALCASWRGEIYVLSKYSIQSEYDLKIFSAYLKGVSNHRIMAFFFLKYLFSFQKY